MVGRLISPQWTFENGPSILYTHICGVWDRQRFFCKNSKMNAGAVYVQCWLSDIAQIETLTMSRRQYYFIFTTLQLICCSFNTDDNTHANCAHCLELRVPARGSLISIYVSAYANISRCSSSLPRKSVWTNI